MPRILAEAAIQFNGETCVIRKIELPSKSPAIRVFNRDGALIKQRGETKPFLREVNDAHRLGVSLISATGITKTVNELGSHIINAINSRR